MSNSTVTIDFTEFDFNKDDSNFIRRQLSGVYSKSMNQLSDDFQYWGMTRSANPALTVGYQMKIMTEATADSVRSMQYFDIHDVGTVVNNEPTLSVAVFSGSSASQLLKETRVTIDAEKMFGIYDAAFKSHKAEMPPCYISAYHSLRPLLSQVAAKASGIYVQDRSILFAVIDGDNTYAVKVISTHLRFQTN